MVQLSMFDWFLLFAPILVLPVILLFAFVGCTFDPTGTVSVPLKMVVRFHPARQDMSRYRVIVDIVLDGEYFPTQGSGPVLLPDGDSQFEFSSEEFNSDFGSYSIICSVYLDEISGTPDIGPTLCEFEFSFENDTATFIIDNFDNVTTAGCQTT